MIMPTLTSVPMILSTLTSVPMILPALTLLQLLAYLQYPIGLQEAFLAQDLN